MPELPPDLSLFTAINLLGAAQGGVLALALVFYGEGDRVAHRVLAAFVLVVSLTVAETFLCTSNLILRAPHLVDSTEPLGFAIGPLLYLYVRALVRGGPSVRRRSWWHAAPAALYALYLVPFYLSPVSVKVAAFLSVFHPNLLSQYPGPGEPAFLDAVPLRAHLDALLVVSFVGYAAAAAVTAGRAWWRPEAGRQRSNGAALGVLAVAFALPILVFVAGEAAGLGDAKEPLVAAVASFTLYAVGYLALLQPHFMREGVLVEAPPEKYARSALTEDQEATMKEVVVRTLEAGERFRDPDLKLATFARACGLSAHHVSQVANAHFGGFADFVGRRRVEAARVLLATPEGRSLTLEEVGYRSGFNSRTAFYTAFKKHEGCPPSEYRAAVAEADEAA